MSVMAGQKRSTIMGAIESFGHFSSGCVIVMAINGVVEPCQFPLFCGMLGTYKVLGCAGYDMIVQSRDSGLGRAKRNAPFQLIFLYMQDPLFKFLRI